MRWPMLLLPFAMAACHRDATPSPTTTTSTSTPAASGTTAATTTATTIATGEVTEGKPPPPLKAKAHDGTPIDLSAMKGKAVVVYFYPKDETPGCTKEACSFRDAWDKLQQKGVVLIGISADSDESHRAFAAHHKLPFLLVSDEKGTIAQAFGVPFQNGFTARQSFVIGPDGNVKKIYRKVDVTVHADEIMKDVQ